MNEKFEYILIWQWENGMGDFWRIHYEVKQGGTVLLAQALSALPKLQNLA